MCHILVPSHFYRHWLIKHLKAQHKIISSSLQISTLDELISPQKTDPHINQTLILKTLITDAFSNTHFESISHTKGAAHHAKRFIKELMQNNVSRKTLERINGLDTEDRALLRLFSRYDAALERLNTQNKYVLFKREKLADFKHQKKQVLNKSLFLLGFHTIKAYQKPLLQALISTAKTCSWLLYFQPNHPNYAPTATLRKWILELPLHCREISCTKPRATPSKNTICCTPYPASNEEVAGIAKWIQQYLRQHPEIMFEDIAIVLPYPSKYLALINWIFPKHQIPVQQQAHMFSKTSIGYFVTCFLNLACQPSIDRESFLRFFQLPFSQSIIEPKTNQPLTLDYLYLRNLAYQTDFEDMHSWVAALKGNSVAPEHIHTTHVLALETISQRLQALSNANSIPQFLSIFQDVLKLFDIEQNISATQDSTANNTAISQHIKANQSALSFLKGSSLQLKTHLQSTAPFFSKANALVLSAMAFFQDAELALENELPNTVQLIDKKNAYGLSKKIIVIPGCIQNQWPEQPLNNIFLSDALKKKLKLPYHQHPKEKDQHLFHALINQATDTTLITWPLTKNSLPTIMSPFLSQIKKTPCPQKTTPAPSATTNPAKIIPEKQRKSPGYFTHAHAKKIWEERFARPFSVTELEQYQECPHHYFYRFVLNEPGPPPATEDVPPQIWGCFIHEIMAAFYSQKIQTKAQPTLSDFNALTKKTLKSYTQNSYFWKLRQTLLLEGDKKVNILAKVYAEETLNPISLPPFRTEMPFTIQVPLPEIPASGPIIIKGKIDLLLKRGPSMAILDFKTGATLPTLSDIQQHRSLQLPLYCHASEKLIEKSDCQESYLYQIRIDGSVQKKRFKKIENQADALEKHIQLLATMIQKGEFDHAPYAALQHMHTKRLMKCRSCAYLTICEFETN